MATKKSVKYRTDNIFERMTGLKIYTMVGGSECQIVPHPRILYKNKQYMTRAVAASLYYDMNVTDLGRVSSTCGVANCVHPNHLILQGKKIEKTPVNKFHNLSKAGRAKIKEDIPDENGFYYGYHRDIWATLTDAGKELARKGEYSTGLHGFLAEYTILKK